MPRKTPQLEGDAPKMYEDVPAGIKAVDVDVTPETRANNSGVIRSIISRKFTLHGHDYWYAKRSKQGQGYYWTRNKQDPKIINFYDGKNTARGNVLWNDGSGNIGGRPPEAKNRKSVNDYLREQSIHPAEFFAAVMTGDPAGLRKYRVSTPSKDIKMSEKIKCAQILIDKVAGNAKAVEVDNSGDRIESSGEDSSRPQIQVYMPSTETGVVIQAKPEEVKELESKGFDSYMNDNLEVVEDPTEVVFKMDN